MNVREIVQLAARTRTVHAALLCDEKGCFSLTEHIALYSRSSCPSKASYSQSTSEYISPPLDPDDPRDALARQLEEALRAADGNVSIAAKSIGVSRPMAYRLMKRLPHLDPEAIRLESVLN